MHGQSVVYIFFGVAIIGLIHQCYCYFSSIKRELTPISSGIRIFKDTPYQMIVSKFVPFVDLDGKDSVSLVSRAAKSTRKASSFDYLEKKKFDSLAKRELVQMVQKESPTEESGKSFFKNSMNLETTNEGKEVYVESNNQPKAIHLETINEAKEVYVESTNQPKAIHLETTNEAKEVYVESINQHQTTQLKLTNQPKTTHSQSPKTVEFSSGDGGFGNNVLGLVSAYMIASLTNATLSLVYPTTLDSLFTITDLQGHIITKSTTKHDSFKRVKAENICFRDNTPLVNRLKKESVSTIFNETHIVLSSNCPLFMWMLYNEQTYHQVVQLGLLPEEPFSQTDPTLRGFALLSTVLRNHFIPHERILAAVKNWTKEFAGYTTVGFHIRKGDKHSDFKESRNFIYNGDVSSFSSCEVFSKVSNPLIFVASDSTEAKKQVELDNPTRKVIISSAVAQHTYSAVRKEGIKHLLDDVLIDMLTLASCDYVIGTWKSSYSILAGAFQGHLPYFVSRNKRCFIPKRVLF